MHGEQIINLTFEVAREANKQKLGDYLFDNLRTLSKMYLRELVKEGKCEVNGINENTGYRLRPGDFIELAADLTRGTAMRPEAIALDIVFEDEHIIVINKPAGMLVHPSHRENSGTLLNALVFYLNRALPVDVRKSSAFPEALEETCGYAADRRHSLEKCEGTRDGEAQLLRTSSGEAARHIRPGLPHRLDKQTSGLIVAAKNPTAHRILSGYFMKKRVEKKYLALVEGIVRDESGEIRAPIGRFADLKHWSVKDDGKPSITRFLVQERFENTTLLQLEPVTGRTNQLRIHCEMIGHPIVGDTRRGGRNHGRLCLHAWKLAFPHPATQEMMRFETPIKF